jgi:hypothetical protein
MRLPPSFSPDLRWQIFFPGARAPLRPNTMRFGLASGVLPQRWRVLFFLSVIYDYHGDFPSRNHPFFTSGRLLLGALVPFMLLFVHGIDRALKNFGGRAKFLVLAAIIAFMLISEITIDWPVFSNPYNWFHM